MIQEMENNLMPKGSIDLVGFGRLGLRTGINLIQIHRGGPSKITVIDGQKISESDIIFLLKGAEVGTYKADFLKKLSTHHPDFREVISITEDISEFDDSNPVVEELRKEGIVKDHMLISTNTFIRDSIPITPYVLDDIANIITKEALKLLIEKNNE